MLHVLAELSSEGHVYCPREQLVEGAVAILEIYAPIIEEAITSLSGLGHVVLEQQVEGHPVYLKALHISEEGAAARLRTILSVPTSPITIDVDRAISWFEEQQHIALAAQQQEAIRQAVTSKVLVVTGGPGVGKATIVNGIIRILEKKGRRITARRSTGCRSWWMRPATSSGRRSAQRSQGREPSPRRRAAGSCSARSDLRWPARPRRAVGPTGPIASRETRAAKACSRIHQRARGGIRAAAAPRPHSVAIPEEAPSARNPRSRSSPPGVEPAPSSA